MLVTWVPIRQQAPAAARKAMTAWWRFAGHRFVGLHSRGRRRIISHDDVVGSSTRIRRDIAHFLAARFLAALAIFLARAGFDALAGAPSSRAM